MIIIDLQKRVLVKDGKEVLVQSNLSFNLLVYLASSNGMVRTRQDIIEKCWDSKIVTSRSVDVQVCKLREIIGDPINEENVIIGVKKIGYKVNTNNIKLINQNGAAPKKSQDGYAFLKYAKFKGESVVILQNIKDVDDWIVIPKSEYI